MQSRVQSVLEQDVEMNQRAVTIAVAYCFCFIFVLFCYTSPHVKLCSARP